MPDAFDALDTAPPPNVQGGNLSFDELDTAPPPNVPAAQTSTSGQTVEPVPGWSKAFQLFANHWEIGASAVAKGTAGWGLAVSDQPFEDAQQQVQTQALTQAMKDDEDYGNTDGYSQMAQKFGGWLTEQLPTMGLGGAAMATGAGVAAVFGAPVVVGAAAGGALLFGMMAAGQHMYDAMQSGVDRDSARVSALAVGIANAAITYVSGGSLGKEATAAGASLLNTQPVRQALLGTAMRLAKSMGIQIGAGEASALVDGVAKYVVTRASAGATQYTRQQALDDFLRASVQTFTTAPALAIGGEAVGHVTGRIFKNPVQRTQALQGWLDQESTAIAAKHQQRLYSNASAVMQAPIAPNLKALAIKQLTTEAERNTLVDQAVLAAKVRQAANPQGGVNPLISDNPLEEGTFVRGKLTKTAERHAPWSRTFGMPFTTQEGQLAMAFQDTPNPEELAHKFGTSDAVEEAATLRRDYSNRYYGHLQKATKLAPAKIQDLEHKAFTDELTIDHIDANGKQAQLKLTAGQTLQYVLWAENDDAQAALFEPFHLSADGTKIGNSFTVDTIRAMKNALYDSEPKYLAALDGLKAFYREMGPILKTDYESLNPGETLNLQHNYGGSIYRDGATETVMPENKLAPLMPGGEVKNPRFTHSRGPSKIFIQPRDAFQNAANRVRQQAQWRAMAPHAPLWDALMDNRQFKSAVETKFGPKLYKSIKQGYIDTISGVPQAQQWGSKWLNKVMSARSFSKLAAKPLQMGKHMTTLINFTQYQFRGKPIPGDAFTAGVLDAHLHWGQAVKEAFASDAVKNRYANPEAIVAQLNADSMKPGELRTQRFFMKPFEWGDQYALIAGRHMVYKYVLEQTGDAAIANAEADRAWKNVLASGSMDQRAPVSRHPIGRILGQFRQPEIRLAQTVVERWRKAANFPTPENIQDAFRTHLLSNVAAAFFVLPETVLAAGGALLAGGHAAEDADQKWFEFLQRLQLGNQFPVIDDLLKTVHTIGWNTVAGSNHQLHEFSTPPADSMESVGKLAHDFVKWSDGEGDLHLIYRTVLDAIGSANLVGAGAPEAPIRGLDWVSEVLGLE